MSQKVVICSGGSVINLDVCDTFNSNMLSNVSGVEVMQLNGCLNIVIKDSKIMQQIIDMIVGKSESNSGGTRFY